MQWQHSKKTWCYAIVCGALFYAPSSATYFKGCHHLGTGLAMVIFYAYPAFVMLYGWSVMRQKVTKDEVVAIIGIIVGCAIIADLNNASIHLAGISLEIVSALCYASYMIASHRWLPQADLLLLLP